MPKNIINKQAALAAMEPEGELWMCGELRLLDKGSNWELVEDKGPPNNPYIEPHYYLQNGTERLSLEYHEREQKWDVHCHWDHSLWKWKSWAKLETTRSINVSATKTAKQMAGDIFRRLIPTYRHYTEKLQAEKDLRDGIAVQCAENLRVLQESAGLHIEIRMNDGSDHGSLYAHKRKEYYTPFDYGDIFIAYNSATFKLMGLPVELAEQILRLCDQYASKERVQ